MDEFGAAELGGMDLSVTMTETVDTALVAHLDKGEDQEDLTFAYWRPSRGAHRFSAVLVSVVFPRESDRLLAGNVAFTANYLTRVLEECPEGQGIALLHSHLEPGWQGMSDDDVVAERDRLAAVVAGRTGLPLVGLTWGTDGTWSARFWLRTGRFQYGRFWASSVRSVGKRLRMSFNPEILAEPKERPAQRATRSVWGAKVQGELARIHVGVIGLGSVGSIVAETLSRTGFSRITLVDHDVIEERNLDRTLGAYPSDAMAGARKVHLSERLIQRSHTAESLQVNAVVASVAAPSGMAAALDCDVLISCVDRPWPRHLLNNLAYQHLIPLIDGGIIARVNDEGRLLHVDWRVHTVGPGRACLYCLDALRRSDVSLDREGLLDDSDYIQNLTSAERERYQRRNVFAFSLSVAAHQVLQLVTLVSGNERVGGTGPQTYHAYPGVMEVRQNAACTADCDVRTLTAAAGEMLPES